MKGAAPIALLGLLGCGPSRTTLEVPEAPAAAQSWIFAAAHGAELVMETGAVADAIALQLRLSRGASGPDPFAEPGWTAPIQAEFAWFEADLALPPGRVELASPSAMATRALPRPAIAYRAELSASSNLRFGEVPWASLRASQAELPVNSTCDRFGATQYSLPFQSGAGWAVSDGPDRALVGGFEDAIYRISADGSSARVALSGTSSLTAAFEDARARLWLADPQGTVWTASLAPSLNAIRAGDLGVLGRPIAMDGDPEHPEHDLYVVTDQGSIARLRGSRATSFEPLSTTTDLRASVAWIEPDSALAASAMASSVLLIQGDRATRIPVADDRSGVYAVRRVPGLGILAATVGGQIYRYDPSGPRFELIGPSAVKLDVASFVVTPDGFLYGGTFGYVGQWIQGFGFCPIAAQPLASATAKFLVPLGNAWLAIGDPDRFGSQTPYSVVERLRP
ncbi:MAG: hypothetical protein U1E65_07115 [Myxococcota bacterium]